MAQGITVVGARHTQGEYEGNQYNNLVLFVNESLDEGKGVGFEAYKISVKYALVEEFIRKQLAGDWANIIGKQILPIYDRNAKVSGLALV